MDGINHLILSLKTSLDLGLDTFLDKLKRDDRGVTAIEYGLIAALIAVVIIASVTLVGNYLAQVFTRIGNALSNALAT